MHLRNSPSRTVVYLVHTITNNSAQYIYVVPKTHESETMSSRYEQELKRTCRIFVADVLTTIFTCQAQISSFLIKRGYIVDNAEHTTKVMETIVSCAMPISSPIEI